MKKTIKSIIRNFNRKPTTNLIKLLGLSVSLTLVIILSLYGYSELTTDNFHQNGDRVYLFSDKNNMPGIYTPGILKDQIDLNTPGVESTVRMAGPWETPIFQTEGKEPIASDLLFADEDFFKLFSYKVIEGNPGLAMKEPLTVIITKTLSQKLFGKESAIGKTINLNHERELTVKAVIEEPKANSALLFSAITSIETRKIVMPNAAEFTVWPLCIFQTFVLLKDGINPEETAKNISSLFPKEMLQKESAAKLIPLKELYYSQFSLIVNNYLRCGDKRKVMILLMVAALILIIALVNFINISSSQWTEKIKQTGVLKVHGASHSSLIANVIYETFLFFLTSLFLALIFATIASPSICNYTGIQFNQQLILTPIFLGIVIAITFFLSIIFSLIPAFRISTSKAIDNLNKTIEPHTKKTFSGGILVTLQFTVTIVLIAFTMLIQKQVNFGSNKLGFNQENVIGIKLTPELMGKREVLKKLLLEKPSVEKISFTQYFPNEPVSYCETQTEEAGIKKPIKYDTFGADAGFFETMGLELINGRYFSENMTTDANKVVVNESFLLQNNLSNPIGTKFPFLNGNIYEIVGVIKDFHYKPFNSPILPLAIRNEPYASYCLVSIKTGNYDFIHNFIRDTKNLVANLSPSFPVEISFMDMAVGNLYQSELNFRRLFSLFALCAIIICCLGILAMSLFACQHRIKEIGIRKVNGARVTEVMAMLNKDFVKWVVVAFIIAIPIAWLTMHHWLENFAYKTTLSWWIFALAGILALGIALLTVSWQSWKAARRNPVGALKYE